MQEISTPFLHTLADEAIKSVIPLILTLISAGAAYATGQIINFLGIKNAEKKATVQQIVNDAFHTAAWRSIDYATTKAGFTIESIADQAKGTGKIDPEKIGQLVQIAVDEYLKPKMKETIDKLGASDRDIRDIVMQKIGQRISDGV